MFGAQQRFRLSQRGGGGCDRKAERQDECGPEKCAFGFGVFGNQVDRAERGHRHRGDSDRRIARDDALRGGRRRV